ncbi:Uma2 family endonuclease [Acaryochloris sp. IP29b_bin.148]|uniref:Uma2 family endonuclease n=1 Tax=Acaryochloris sp. IP29b_bin.148 TaxID=2969218 RepID=UPI0026168BA9|nr:Uma2 family endonuclease [Acaryochloris sp. IP29b_bin.148]
MTTTLDISSITTETRTVLIGVSWDTYERLLTETGAARHQRFAYNNERLEIMVPLASHEEPTRLLDDFVAVLVDTLGIELRKLGSLTLKNTQQQKGLEPDCCFYIQNEAEVRGIDTLDFAVHPPPDLVVEVDNTSQSLDKFPIYVALKVPEIWRLRHNTLMIYGLDPQEQAYKAQSESIAFPGLPITDIPQFILMAKQDGQRSAIRAFRQAVQDAQKDGL